MRNQSKPRLIIQGAYFKLLLATQFRILSSSCDFTASTDRIPVPGTYRATLVNTLKSLAPIGHHTVSQWNPC